VSAQRVVEVDFSLLGELNDRQGGERLGRRGKSEDRVRLVGYEQFLVGHAVSPGKHRLAAVAEQYRSGELVLGGELCDEPVVRAAGSQVLGYPAGPGSIGVAAGLAVPEATSTAAGTAPSMPSTDRRDAGWCRVTALPLRTGPSGQTVASTSGLYAAYQGRKVFRPVGR
jgi:hypothetical protein